MCEVQLIIRNAGDVTVFYKTLFYGEYKEARHVLMFLKTVFGCEIDTIVQQKKYWAVLREDRPVMKLKR